MLGFAEIRSQARRDIHAAFAVPATYQDDVVVSPVGLAVRWHNRFVKAVGDFGGDDYATVLENIDRIVFNSEELAAAGVTPKRNGVITLLPEGYPGTPQLTLLLDVREPTDGPINVIWTVLRPKQGNPGGPP